MSPEGESNPSSLFAQAARGRTARVLAIVLSAGLLGAASPWIGSWFARSTIVDIGPTDGDFATGFRDLERDGDVYFRWSSVPSSRIDVPVRLCDAGSIRLRVRRHFPDPAHLVVSVSGIEIGRAQVAARVDSPYSVIEFPVSKGLCQSSTPVLLESTVGNERPLGVAVDWIEMKSSAGLRPATSAMVRSGFTLALIALVLCVPGLSLSGSSLGALAGAVTIAAVFAVDPASGTRGLAGGFPALLVASAISFLVFRFSVLKALDPAARQILVAVGIATVAARCLWLDLWAFYPDYRVHALVAQTLSSQGLPRFLDNLFEIQYARSLGLQQINGSWYPFPYPPGAYLVIQVFSGAFGLNALDACVAAAIAAAALIPILTAAIGLRCGVPQRTSIAAALVVSLHPLLVRRMALGYFPGVIGQAMDLIALLALLSVLKGSPPIRLVSAGSACILLAGAFLIYTQSIVNFGLLVAGLVAAEFLRQRGPRREVLFAGAIALIALSASFAAFYVRYIPVMQNVADGRPQPEASALLRLEEIRAEALRRATEPVEIEDGNDPFAGATVNPVRGLGRFTSRLWRFHGPFAILIPLGLLLVVRKHRLEATFLGAWFAVSVWISVLAAGLPSPNGFQHLKDLEFVVPLIGLSLASVWVEVRERSFGGAIFLGLAWFGYASAQTWVEFTDRLLPILQR